MVTSGLFQIRGSVKVKESVLYPDYFKPKSYWENEKIVYNREGKGYISFGNKYLSYRVYPDDEATHIPYEDIKKIELEDKIEKISDPRFRGKLEPNQNSVSIYEVAFKSIVTIINNKTSQNPHNLIEEIIPDLYSKFGYEYLTLIDIKKDSKDKIQFSERKLHYNKIRSVEFKDEIFDLYKLKMAKLQTHTEKLIKDIEGLKEEKEKRIKRMEDLGFRRKDSLE